ncbi:TPA: hypothetical protein ACGD48_004751 [Serratia marcescens]
MAAVNKNPPAAKKDAKTEKKTPATNGTEVVTEGQVDSQPGPESKASDDDKPASDPDAPDGDKPASDPDAPDGGKPTSDPDAPDGDKPASDPEASDGDKPASDPDAPDGGKPTSDPEAPNGDKPASDPDEENDGTTVPGENEGDNVTQNLLERVSVVFLGPYQRYSRGDLAGFSPEYAKQLVERGHACWPKDADKLMKGSAGDEYPYGI